MRNRIASVAVALLATTGVAGLGSLALFADAGTPFPSPPAAAAAPGPAATTSTTITATTLPPPTTSTGPPSPTTSSTSTTTTTEPPRVTLEVTNGTADGLGKAVTALYEFMADPSARGGFLPDGMAGHLEAWRSEATLDLEAEVYRDELADGTRVAVVLVGDDVVLAVADGGRWRLAGAHLASLGADPWYGDPVRHILVLGTDARPHQSPPGYRADSIHILGASLSEGGGGVVGFPRDTWVETSYGNDKFSSVNVRGGTAEMVSIAEDLSGIELEGYLLTGFAGFKHLVNAFGGVEVDVPFRMADGDSNAFLQAGLQILKGGDALAFSRNRHIDGGDFTRSRHQGVVIKAGLTGAQAMGIETLPRLLRLLTADTWTDLSPTQLLQLGAIAFSLDPGRVGNVVLPGRVGTAGRASVVHLTGGADAVFADLADGVVSAG